MNTTQNQRMVTGLQGRVPPAGFVFQREHFGLLNVFYLTLAFINLLIAMVTGSSAAYRLLPAWFLLLALTSASSFLQDMKVVAWLLTVALSVGVEFLRYREYHSEILFRTVVNYAPLTAFMLILYAARLEELRTRRDQDYARLKILRSDTDDRLKQLRKLRSGEIEETNAGQVEALREKELTFEIYQEIYPRVLKARFKREIPPILQFAAEACFGLECGVIFEIPQEKNAEVQIRAQWGLPDSPETTEQLTRYARSDLVRTCDDSRTPLQPEFIKRKPNLYEEFDTFSKDIFPIECLFPCVVLGKTMFVMIAGKATGHGRVRYEFNLLNPIFLSCGQAMSKLIQRDARASFSTFNPEN
jgi:hypothetical protein